MNTPFKLYYTPSSCGAASFLTATIGGLTFDSETVDLRSRKTKSGADFLSINPKGNVPTIAFEDGTILNENVATLTYLADRGNADLAPAAGTRARYQYLNHLAFITSELHPSFGPLFNPATTPEGREAAQANLTRRLAKLDTLLQGNAFLNGSSLSAADVYAYIVLTWTGFIGFSLPPTSQAYLAGLEANPEIQKAQAALKALQ